MRSSKLNFAHLSELLLLISNKVPYISKKTGKLISFFLIIQSLISNKVPYISKKTGKLICFFLIIQSVEYK